MHFQTVRGCSDASNSAILSSNTKYLKIVFCEDKSKLSNARCNVTLGLIADADGFSCRESSVMSKVTRVVNIVSFPCFNMTGALPGRCVIRSNSGDN